MDIQKQVSQLLFQEEYTEVASIYEQLIEDDPSITSHYYYLGLSYLLQGYEEEAQATWMLAIAEGEAEETESWTEELLNILEAEAQRQFNWNNLHNSWLIRQHIREIAPNAGNNILHLIQLSIAIDRFTLECLNNWQLTAVLKEDFSQIDRELLLQVLKELLAFPSPETLLFAEACILFQEQNPSVFIDTLMLAAVKLAYQDRIPDFAASLAELCLKVKPEHSESLRHLSCFYSNAKLHQQAIETAQLFFDNCLTPNWQIQGSYLILRALLTAGSWLEVEPIAQRHKSLILDLIANPPSENLLPGIASHIFTANFFLPYIQDRPQENRRLQNQVAQLFQKNLQAAYPDVVQLPWSNETKIAKRLKIGYVAHTLRGHSVGWLSRWLCQHYDREAFEFNLYLIHQSQEDHQWFRERVDRVYNFGAEPEAMAKQIKADEIDVLVDLDSLTLDITCQVMALKPAPVQVTWLGWDASGIPAIDYFIADPYVLPEEAQEYYSEKIWRLPHTYVAVDGFEVGVPTLRRQQLEIPDDAVVYLSSQIGYKRHPETVRLQMQIVKQVPNSYFLIKGMADETTIQKFFTQVAESEGVELSKLRFLPRDPSEYVHRANLSIADIILDTYPYNGATTTLETLWMGIPLVTRVGQQFAARNSYTFMMNVGVTEGIAWTNEEYVEWGVRMGKDPALRQQISWKLRQSRQTSPLWNAKQFTREMEKAYKQMWQNYLDS